MTNYLTIIQLKRAHSAEPDALESPIQSRRSTVQGNETPTHAASPAPQSEPTFGLSNGTRAGSLSTADIAPESTIGSPFKRQRASLPSSEEEPRTSVSGIGDVLSRIEDAEKANGHQNTKVPPEPRKEVVDDEEL